MFAEEFIYKDSPTDTHKKCKLAGNELVVFQVNQTANVT